MLRRVLVMSKIKGLRQAVTSAVESSPKLSSALELNFRDEGGGDSPGATGEFEVLLGDPNLCAGFVKSNPGVKWIQSTFAGVEPLVEVKRMPEHSNLTVSRCTALGKDMAQYVAGWIVARERRFFDIPAFQREANWTPETREPFFYRPFDKITVGILGLGDIGMVIAEVLHTMGCTVVGFKRNVSATSSSHVAHISSDLTDVLARSDYVVNVLPSTSATTNLLSGSTLQVCAPRAPVLLNLGRGSVIDESSILHALQSGWISAAVLDVFVSEPLPASSPLWKHPQITITPHVAAVSHPHLVAKAFVANALRYLDGESPMDLLDAGRGY